MNNDNDIKGIEMDTILYTKEAKVSREKTQAELEVADPAGEKALGVLEAGDKKVSQDEQKAD